MDASECEYTAGWRAAASEIEADGWTRDLGQRYLESVSACESETCAAYARGYDDAIRAFVSGRARS